MRVEYDKQVDAAYIVLGEDVRSGEVKRTVPLDPSLGMINLDFDQEGRLVGVEVLSASKRLTPKTLRGALRIDRPNGPTRG